MPMPPGILSLAIAGFVFVASHVLLSSTRLRGSLGEQLGERGFLGVYSLVALVTFAWFVLAYIDAPRIVLWRATVWTALVPIVLMPLATILLVAGYTTPNPTAVGMERAARTDDPAPGVLCVTRHPVLWGIGLWAGAHVVAAGTLAGTVFFAPIALLALGGTLLIDRKKRLALGSNWWRLAQVTSNVPFWALIARRTKLRWRGIGLLRIVAGLLLYLVLYRAHAVLTGMPVVIP
jgi:uncharacterized membrane protein